MAEAELDGQGKSCGLLELSSKVEYALLALLELASDRNRTQPLTIKEIAIRQPVPERYLEQIFTHLRQGGLVQSQRGARGGYVLLRDPWQITVLDIVALVDGERKPKDALNAATLERELVREVWHQSSAAFELALSQCTLHDLCQKRDAARQEYPMYYI
jgi:Rrf2 family protein